MDLFFDMLTTLFTRAQHIGTQIIIRQYFVGTKPGRSRRTSDVLINQKNFTQYPIFVSRNWTLYQPHVFFQLSVSRVRRGQSELDWFLVLWWLSVVKWVKTLQKMRPRKWKNALQVVSTIKVAATMLARVSCSGHALSYVTMQNCFSVITTAFLR